MKIYHEADVNYLRTNSWSGAADRIAELTDSELETILFLLEDCEDGDPISETELNDFFWFDDDTYAEWLGYRDAEHLWTAKEHEGERLFYDGCTYITEAEAKHQFAEYLADCKENGEEAEYEDWEEFAEGEYDDVTI